MSTIGHNSGDVGGIAGDRLRSFIERIERLESEKKDIQTDIKEVYDEAKGTGFDTPIIKEVIKLRKMDTATRQERAAVLELYMNTLGMFSNTPLGRAAMEREKVQAPQADIEDAIKAANDPGAAPIYFEVMETKAGCWTVFHNGAEVYVPMGAEEEAERIVDALTDRAADFGRNLTPAEVRETVLTFAGPDFGPSFNPPYTADALQDDAKEAGAAAAANARATNEGWDAGAAGKTAEDCPYPKKEKALRDRWMLGLKRHQDGSPRPFVIGAAPASAANDDQPAGTSSTVAA